MNKSIRDKDIKVEHRNKKHIKRANKNGLYMPSFSWELISLLPALSYKTFLLFAGIATAHKLRRDDSDYQKIPGHISEIINLNSHTKLRAEKYLMELGLIDVKNECGKKTRYKLLKGI